MSLATAVPTGFETSAPRKRLWSPANVVVATAVVLTCVVFAIFGYLCWLGYGATLEQAKTKAQSAADVVASEARWMIGSAHLLLEHLAGTAATPAEVTGTDQPGFARALADLQSVNGLGLYDASGAVVAGGESVRVPASIAGEDFFKELAAGKTWTVSPQMETDDGSAFFVVAQRLGTSEFGGVVLLAIDGGVLEKLWTPQKLGDGSTVSILREDGWVVGRYPAIPAAINAAQQPLFQQQKDQLEGNYASAVSPADGIARIVGFHRLPEFGLIGLASVSQTSMLASLWNAIVTVLWLMVPIAAALLIGSLVTARILHRSEKIQASLAAALEHNDVLFREIHHRVKNNLQSVSSLLQMQPIPREIKADMGQRIAAMSAVHEHIYRSNNFGTVQAKDYLVTLLDNIRAGANPHIQFVADLADIAIDKDAATPLGLILNEVAANAFKHAFPDGRDGVVTVRFSAAGESEARLTVEDNGVGFDATVPGKGIGRRLIGALTSQLGGTSEFTTAPDGGSLFTLTFPLTRA